MSLHADVAVPASDRRRLERLCHYVARPPLASDRLEERPDGRLALRLKTRWRDGTTHILMEPHEVLERLVPLIPPPRAHQVRYHGVLAPCASARDRVVPGPRPAPVGAHPSGHGTSTHRWEETSARVGPEPSSSTTELVAPELGAGDAPAGGDPQAPYPRDPHPDATAGRLGPRRLPWAELLQRVFAVDALRCPHCGARMRLVAAIEDPDVARKILECLDLPARAPPLVPAPSAPAWDEGEPSDGEPAWELDQTGPDEDGFE